jgi:hypothetical protein
MGMGGSQRRRHNYGELSQSALRCLHWPHGLDSSGKFSKSLCGDEQRDIHCVSLCSCRFPARYERHLPGRQAPYLWESHCGCYTVVEARASSFSNNRCAYLARTLIKQRQLLYWINNYRCQSDGFESRRFSKQQFLLCRIQSMLSSTLPRELRQRSGV